MVFYGLIDESSSLGNQFLACYTCSAFPMNKFIYNLQILYPCLGSYFELWLGTGWETSGCSGLEYVFQSQIV
jgi:hypothetical protein